MKKALMAVGVAVCLMVPAGAQEPPPPAPVVVAQFLGFTETQGEQFRNLLQNLQATMGGLGEQMGPRRQRLEELLNSDAPDPAAVGAALLEIRGLERQARRAFDSYHERFLALLTAEQKERVQAVVQAARLFPAVRAFAEVNLIEPAR